MNNSTGYAGYRWVDGNAPLMMVPWKIWGINRKPNLKLKLLNTPGGTLSADLSNGYEFDIATLSNTTANDNYKFSSYNITGATLTGDQFQFETNDVKVQGNFEHNKTLTLIDGEHAVLSADKDKGFIGDVVTITGTMDEGWYLTGFNTTGATMTGNKFAFAGEDVIVEGLYTDEGFPVVYEAENGVHLTGDPIAIPGQGITLTTSYDTYYRTNGYDITGGYIENGLLYATAACTARLKSRVNAFTATGGWEKGSNVSFSTKNSTAMSIGRHYAIRNASTGDIPASWYSTSNRWNPSNASAYKITLNPNAKVTADCGGAATGKFVCCTLVNTTQNQSQTWTAANFHNATWNYSKSFSTTTQTTYSISGYIAGTGTNGIYHVKTANAGYVATATTGTWTATGYAP